MANTPEYQRGNRIQPTQAVLGFEQAFSQLGQASSGLAAWGGQIANTIAMNEAREQGIQAGKSPGRNLTIPLTQTDAEFVKAYKTEEYNNLLYQGNKDQQKFFDLAKKNLTSSSIAQFEDASQKNIDELLKLSAPDNRPALERGLKGAYEANYSQLVNNLWKKDKEYTESLNNAVFDQGLEDIQNDQIQGQHLLSEEKYNNLTTFINGMAETREWSPEKVLKARIAARSAQQTGYYQGKAQEALEEGDYDKFLSELVKNPPEHLKPIEHAEVVKGVMAYGNQYKSAVAGQQYLESNNAMMELNAGKLTPSRVEHYREVLEPKQFSDLEYAIVQHTAKEDKLVALSSEMIPNFSDPAKMSHYSDEETNKVFAAVVENHEKQLSEDIGQDYKASLLDKASIAQGIKRNIPSLVKELSQAAKYGNAAQASEALRSLNLLNQNNPAAISGLDNDAKGMLYTFGDLLSGTTGDAEESLKLARGDINVDENTRDSRLKAWKEYQEQAPQYDNYNSKLNYIAKNLGAVDGWIFKSPAPQLMPSGLDTKFDRLMTALIPTVPSIERAEQMAFEELSKIYQQTTVNARNEIMAFPPDMIFPNGQAFIKRDKERALKQFIESNQKAKETSGFAFNKVEWIEPEKGDAVFGEPEYGELYANVDGVKRKIIVQSDMNTQWNIEQFPSWAFSYIDDEGIPFPLMDMSMGSVARWVPDLTNVGEVKSKEEYRKEQSAKAKEEYEKRLLEEKYNTANFLGAD